MGPWTQNIQGSGKESNNQSAKKNMSAKKASIQNNEDLQHFGLKFPIQFA